MKTICIASAKGGSGKSTLATALAVRAGQEGRVALLDLDPGTASMTMWLQARGRPDELHLDTGDGLISARVKALAASGRFDFLLIDTPPMDVELIQAAIEAADAVIIPVRCGLFDLAASVVAAEMCREHKRPHAFLLSHVDGRHPILVEQMIKPLSGMGPIFKTRVKYRKAWITALNLGRSAAEFDRESRAEVNGLWDEVATLLRKGRLDE